MKALGKLVMDWRKVHGEVFNKELPKTTGEREISSLYSFMFCGKKEIGTRFLIQKSYFNITGEAFD